MSLSCLSRLLSAVRASWTFLDSNSLTVLHAAQVYGGMSLIAICLMLFSYTDWGSGFGEEGHRGKVLFSSQYIREHTVAVVYEYW